MKSSSTVERGRAADTPPGQSQNTSAHGRQRHHHHHTTQYAIRECAQHKTQQVFNAL